jgi:hypothetical protein
MQILLRNKYRFIVTALEIKEGYKFTGSKRIPIKEAYITGYCDELYTPRRTTTLVLEEGQYKRRINE